MIPQLLVLSSNAMLVLDQRTLAIKYRIPTSEFQALSLSPYSDRLAVFHLRKVRSSLELFVKFHDPGVRGPINNAPILNLMTDLESLYNFL